MAALSARLVAIGGAALVENATCRTVERCGLLVVLREADRVVGLGEATPLPGYGGGNLADAAGLLERAPWDDWARIEPEQLDLAAFVPCARFAIETALLDRRAREQGLALADRLAGRRMTDRVPRAVLVGPIDDPDVFERARGARVIKLKARGRDLELESNVLARLRRELEPHVEIRLDLNGALELPAARRALETYARYGVRWVEEPVRGASLLDLGATETAWIADESLAEPGLASELIDCPNCAGFVLKPTLLGLLSSLELGRRAEQASKLAIVSHTFEGPVALAAAAELALALAPTEACGIDRHSALAVFPSASIPQLDGSPLEIVPTERRGHGVEWEQLKWQNRSL